MPPAFKTAILVISGILLLLFCLNFFGLLDGNDNLLRQRWHR